MGNCGGSEEPAKTQPETSQTVAQTDGEKKPVPAANESGGKQSGGVTAAKREVDPSSMKIHTGPLTGTVEHVIIKSPPEGIRGAKLLDCFIENAAGERKLQDCELRNCVLYNCHLDNCKMELCNKVVGCKIWNGSEITECTLTEKTRISDSKIQKTIISSGSQVENCTLGYAITTTKTNFIGCTGQCPVPAPAPELSTDCVWD